MDLGLKGRRALVTGASSGLGFAIAAELAREGARVVIVARDRARLERRAAEIGAASLSCDLGRADEARGIVGRCEELLGGGLDVLVTNTGGPMKADFAALSDQDWRQGFEGLWLSASEPIRAALPGMRTRGQGRIVLVTSVSAREPIPSLTLSNALRAGLLGLTRSLAREVAAQGVTVNAVLPGWTRTERLVQLGVDEEAIAREIPAGRLGRPEELGALVAYLASDRAAYVTGQSIAVDGGYLHGG